MLKPTVLRRLATLTLALAGVSFVLGWWWGRDAQPVQLVRPTSVAESSLFGAEKDAAGVPGTPIGSPQTLIIRTQAAFLTGNDATVRYVSEPALRAAGEYPLQLKTVTLFRNAATLALLGLSLVVWALALALQRRTVSPSRRHVPASDPPITRDDCE